jgi:hypothetical protein
LKSNGIFSGNKDKVVDWRPVFVSIGVSFGTTKSNNDSMSFWGDIEDIIGMIQDDCGLEERNIHMNNQFIARI